MNVNWLKRVLCVLILLSGLSACGFIASMADIIEDTFQNKVTYKINVVDSEGGSLEYPIVWMIQGKNEEWPKVLMERLVKRYAKDVDFINSEFSPHDALWVLAGNRLGRIEEIREENALGDSARMLVHFAAFKRGYLPVVYSARLKTNTTHDIILRLQKDSGADANSPLFELDRIRGEVEEARQIGMLSQERQRRLEALNQEARALAVQLEKTGQFDDAARVYLYLASMPSVDVFKNAQGEFIGQGFTNGYDEKKPQRRADYLKALATNQTILFLKTKQLFEEFYVNGGLRGPVEASQNEERARLIAILGKLIVAKGEELWPDIYKWYFGLNIDQKEYREACRALNRWYQFEPNHFTLDFWWRTARRVELNIQIDKREGVSVEDGDFTCVVDGLPAFAKTASKL